MNGKFPVRIAQAVWLTVGFLASTMILFGQDPYEGVPPHEVPHCSPAGGLHSAPCRCLGMVNTVQITRTVKCWEDGGFLIARDNQGQPMESLLPDVPPEGEIMQCLEKVPDHCQVVAKQPWYWKYKGKNICRTSCKPERCGCQDSACKAHGPGVYNGFSDDGVPLL